jgi:hypothetical protein
VRSVLVTLLAAAALAACGETEPKPPGPPPPGLEKALDTFKTVVAGAAKPVPAQPGFKVDAAAADGLDAFDLWSLVVEQMITAQPSKADLNPSQWAVWVAFEMQVEVSNGGLAQLYYNSAGDDADEAVEQLRILGAPHHARVLEQANRVIAPHGAVPGREQRQRRLHGLDDARFAALDDAWDLEQLEQLVARFIRAHPVDFFS